MWCIHSGEFCPTPNGPNPHPMTTCYRILSCLILLVILGNRILAQGLEGIIVEDYYTISAADATYINGGSISTPIAAGTKVYRIYVDMAPNYKLNTINGSPLPQGGGPSPNPLDFTTTTNFWNDDNFGTEVPPQTARLDERAAFDSYITIGVTGRSGGAVGCGTNTQQVGTLKTADTNGNLTLCSVYSGFPAGAGTPDGNLPPSAAVPALTYNLGGLIDFTALQSGGNQLVVVGDAWATLPNGTGVDPTGTNRVLIAQLTTNGALSFHINVQLQQPTGGALETYVWQTAGAGEVVSPFLTYPQANVSVAAKAFLEGPFNSGTNLMNDALRTLVAFPTTDPYPGLGYTHAGSGNSGTVAPAVLAVTGNNAIVDWVLLELRNPSTPSAVIASRSALVQRDGDVVDLDGTSAVSFGVAPGNYFVAVRHRNHLGCMTSAAVALSAAPTTVDFTAAATATFGTSARKTVGTAQVLYTGDVTFNGEAKYTGSNNDRDPILVTVGSTTPNNIIANAYSTRDVNLNGNVQYTGSGNDRDPILVNVGSTTPNNIRLQQLP